jgi:uridine monophosphate synthetase
MVARKAAEWGTGLVVGATYPQALARVRALAPEAWILLPGVGAQGGDLYEALAAGLRDDGLGVIVNSSRGIVQAADPGQAARDLKLQINAVRAAFRQAREARPSLLRELAVALADIGAVKFGEFVLASGKTSPVYVDLRLLASHPGVLRLAGHAYADLLGRELGVGGESLDVVLAAIPYAALPIGTAVSLETGLPLIYPRKEAKTHGTGRAIEGEFRPGDRAVVLDDVITTGGSKLQAIEPLAAAGLKVEDVIVLIDREQGGREELEAAGYRLHAVLRLSEMLDMLVEAGKIDEGQRRGVLEYLRAQ